MEETQKEMNLWDMCKSMLRGLANGLHWLLRLLLNMLRLTYRQRWAVLIVMTMFACASLYYTRVSNRRYKVNATLCLNGPSVDEAKARYEALNQNLPAGVMSSQSVSSLLGLSAEEAKALSRFETFRVIDCLHDNTADYVDKKHKNSGTDTLRVQMEDRIAVQFQTKNLGGVPKVAEGILRYMNESEQFQTSYSVYKQNLTRQHEFDKLQVEKLDSLTTFYYRAADAQHVQTPSVNMAMGKKQMVLFLGEIERFFRCKQIRDHRYTLCTAPVSLQGEWVASIAPVNGRMKYLAIFLLAGWVAGCVLALVIEQWKQIIAFLRTRPS